jgi:hypothetical protein
MHGHSAGNTSKSLVCISRWSRTGSWPHWLRRCHSSSTAARPCSASLQAHLRPAAHSHRLHWLSRGERTVTIAIPGRQGEGRSGTGLIIAVLQYQPDCAEEQQQGTALIIGVSIDGTREKSTEEATRATGGPAPASRPHGPFLGIGHGTVRCDRRARAGLPGRDSDSARPRS